MNTMARSSLISKDTVKAHRMTWWVLVDPVERTWMRRTSSMRGWWPGYDVECTCGWKSATGGAVKSYIDKIVWDHRFDAEHFA